MCNQLHDFKGIVEEMKNISSTILKLINPSLSQKVADFFCIILIMTQKIDISHIFKFNGSYFNILKHKLILIFKIKKLWSIVDGTEPKPINPTQVQIDTSAKHDLPQEQGAQLYWKKEILSF